MTTHASPSLSERYQRATNYTPQSIQGQGGLDFSRQPSPFKTWHQARRVVLPAEDAAPDPGPLDLARLGRLLHRSYGITLVREVPGMSMHYRAAPSAGGLYPTELYVAVRDVEGIPDGIFAYDARERALVLCWEGTFAGDLLQATFDHPAAREARAILIGTAVHQRSAWRYGDRAYRRVLLDTGHVFGGAIAAAPADGLEVTPIAAFHDASLEGLLLLDPAEEGVLLLAAVLEASDTPTRDAPLRSTITRESDEPAEGDWIARIHDAGRMDVARSATTPFAPTAGPPDLGPPVSLAEAAPDEPAAILETIRQRRSTRVFSPTSIDDEALGRVLAYAYPPDAHRISHETLETWVVVAGVSDVPAGVHRYDPNAHALAPVRFGNPREALHRCVLWQELGRDCAFAVVHTIDLAAAVDRYGDRAYRAAHLDAGIVGHRLNLAALREGLGASGIGGFFDEHLAALLHGEPGRAVVYVTTVGVPAT